MGCVSYQENIMFPPLTQKLCAFWNKVNLMHVWLETFLFYFLFVNFVDN